MDSSWEVFCVSPSYINHLTYLVVTVTDLFFLSLLVSYWKVESNTLCHQYNLSTEMELKIWLRLVILNSFFYFWHFFGNSMLYEEYFLRNIRNLQILRLISYPIAIANHWMLTFPIVKKSIQYILCARIFFYRFIYYVCIIYDC